MEKLATAYAMALLPRSGGRSADAGETASGRFVLRPDASFLSLSAGIYRVIRAAERLWNSATARRAGTRSGAASRADTVRC